jgi:hypothetical protein
VDHCVTGLQDFEIIPIKHQPGPPAAELSDGTLGQLFFARVHAPKCRFHLLSQGHRWLTAALGFETTPVEAVVPRLRRIIEDASAIGLSGRNDCDLIERQIGTTYAR